MLVEDKYTNHLVSLVVKGSCRFPNETRIAAPRGIVHRCTKKTTGVCPKGCCGCREAKSERESQAKQSYGAESFRAWDWEDAAQEACKKNLASKNPVEDPNALAKTSINNNKIDQVRKAIRSRKVQKKLQIEYREYVAESPSRTLEDCEFECLIGTFATSQPDHWRYLHPIIVRRMKMGEAAISLGIARPTFRKRFRTAIWHFCSFLMPFRPELVAEIIARAVQEGCAYFGLSKKTGNQVLAFSNSPSRAS